MTKKTKLGITLFSIIILIIVGGLYLFYSFLTALAPPKINVTQNSISTDQEFTNGITIEKIKVDSMCESGYPVKYTVIYATSCGIQNPQNKRSKSPDKIQFYKPGNYIWDEDTIHVRYEHTGLGRERLDNINEAWWLNKFGKHSVCPLKFEHEQWYFFTIGDPQVIGIFFYIDSTGKEHQYFLPSGISPI